MSSKRVVTTGLALLCSLAGCQGIPELDPFKERTAVLAEETASKLQTADEFFGSESVRLLLSSNKPPARPTSVSGWRPHQPDAVQTVSSERVEAEAEALPIDLPTVLRLAGAQNWNIVLAAERVREARAALDAAEARWLPSLVGGFIFTRHNGQLQSTPGQVSNINRNAVFLGGGAQLGNAPVAGASGGPARMFVDVSLSELLFAPLVARQQLTAVEASESATFNDTLLAAGSAYFNLVRAQGDLANRRNDLQNSEALLAQTRLFVLAGKGSNADTARSAADVERRKVAVVEAEAEFRIASARLARQLRLDPAMTLFSLQDHVLAVELVDPAVGFEELLAQAGARRPELAAGKARVEAAEASQQAEQWRPWLPHLTLGTSAGAFGGGPGGQVDSMNGRSDFDVLAIWRVENLGFGTRAAREAATSRLRQAEMALERERDGVTTEVTTAWHRLRVGRKRMALAREQLKQASENLRLNRIRIRGLQGLPLEALQAVDSVARGRGAVLEATIGYNRAQLQLLRAIGRPITAE